MLSRRGHAEPGIPAAQDQAIAEARYEEAGTLKLESAQLNAELEALTIDEVTHKSNS